MEKLKIIVTGFIGLYPTGGVTWDYIQYPLGLRMLGHDVYYIEDTGQYSYYKIESNEITEPTGTVEYLNRTMHGFGFGDKWAYRDLFTGKCYGLPIEKVLQICKDADVFINISSSSIFREEYFRIPKRVLIDTDPMFTQVQMSEKKKVDPRFPVIDFSIHDYTHYFSFGENIGKPDCLIPTLNINWLTTRQPICLDCWKKSKSIEKQTLSFTTVMNWSTRSKISFQDELWGQKDVEFKKFLEIPQLSRDVNFKIVLAVSDVFKKDLKAFSNQFKGWEILQPTTYVETPKQYQLFIDNSDGEFSVAKETYIRSNSGWFSCRSACYLALGKPVVTQETGWSEYLPSNEGLLSFIDLESALVAIEKILRNYNLHSKKAMEIAVDFFDSNKVLIELLEKINSNQYQMYREEIIKK